MVVESEPDPSCKFTELVIVIYRKPIYMSGQLPFRPEAVILRNLAADPCDVACARVDLYMRRNLELADQSRCKHFLASMVEYSDGVIGTVMETHRFEGDRQDEHLIYSPLHLI